MRPLPRSIWPSKNCSVSIATRQTSTVAPSRSAIRPAPAALASFSRSCLNFAVAARATESPAPASVAVRASPLSSNPFPSAPGAPPFTTHHPLCPLAPCLRLALPLPYYSPSGLPAVAGRSMPSEGENRMGIEKVGVVGCGLMGSGIAQVAAQAGYAVTVREVSPQIVEKGLQSIEKNLGRQVEKGTLTAADRDQVRGRLRGTTNLEDLKDCDIIIEAILEQVPAKRELYAALDKICPPSTIFASNTSSISITELAVSTQRPTRFLGLHFFNPVPVMKLVEVIRTIATDAAVFDEVVAFAAKLGKTPVRTTDRTGFIVNRLLVPYLLDAVRALEEGVGSIEDIDNSMKLGCGHPMGPLTLLDFVGLDTTYYIANIMFDEFKERRFAPPALLKRMVLAGWNGRKAGRGFYNYADPAKPKPMQLT